MFISTATVSSPVAIAHSFQVFDFPIMLTTGPWGCSRARTQMPVMR